MPDYEEISRRAEADLNTYQSKTGEARRQADDEAGINSMVEKKFSSAEVRQGDELSTNSGDRMRIPPSEGGVLDDRGRQPTADQYDGYGGPIDKIKESYRQQPGQNDGDVVPGRVSNVQALGGVNDIATRGQDASTANVGKNPPGPGGAKYKNDEYVPESVPDRLSAQGNIAPDSVVEASREADAA